MDQTSVQHLAAALRAARAVVALTGAGMSAESGVPTFRGPGGLWRQYRPEDLATPDAFERDPGLVWEWYRWRRDRIRGAEPNPGHLALARLESRLSGFLVVTQNVDGLHRRAGSRQVIELHGNLWRARCLRGCGYVVDQFTESPAEPDEDPRRVPSCPCGSMLRPDVVWFGEALDVESLERSFHAASACNVLLVVGTSSLVYPAAALPHAAAGAGALVAEINVDETPLSAHAGIVIRGPSGVVLPEVERCL